MTKVAPQAMPMKDLNDQLGYLEEEYGEYMNVLNAEKTESDKAKRLRSFPLPLSVKRDLLTVYGVRSITSCSERCEESCHRCRVSCSNSCSNLQLWSRHLVVIEGMFGAGVRSYFTLLRSLLILNAILFLLFLVFVLVPQGIYSTTAAENAMLTTLSGQSGLAYNCSLNYSTKMYYHTTTQTTAAKVLDFLSGTGWMEKTILFIGGYFPTTTTVANVPYNTPLAYMLIVGVFFLASIIVLLVFAGRSFKQNIVVKKSVGVSRYGNSVLAGWDYSLVNIRSVQLKHNMLYNDFDGNLEDVQHREEMAGMNGVKKCCLYTVRALINILILAMLGGAAYLIYYMQVASSTYTAKDLNAGSIERLVMEYLPSITITAIEAVFPIIFAFIASLEKYSSEVRIIITLVRFVIVKLFSIGVLAISLYSLVTCGSKNTCNIGTGTCQAISCWESYVGQQFYKLAITQFLVFLIVTFGVEGFRALIVKKCKCKLSEIIGLPEFNIPKCVLDLIYVQIITWFGTLFCPFLPGITTLIFFILFYLKLFSCNFSYRPSKTPFKANRASFMFPIILMVAFFVAIVPIGYCIVKIPTSKSCGPYRAFSTMYDVVPQTIAAWPEWARTLFQWVGSAAFIALILIMLFIIIYYHATLSSTRLSINRQLQAQVNVESRNKQRLFRQLVQAGVEPDIKGQDGPPRRRARTIAAIPESSANTYTGNSQVTRDESALQGRRNAALPESFASFRAPSVHGVGSLE